MSHEGIRIVPQNVADEVNAQQQQELSHDAVHPQHVRVNKTEGTGVEIIWKDGHTSQWTFPWLRDACPCAMCVEEREATGRKPGQPKSQPKTALPMFKEAVRPKNVRPVGRYALSFEWNDGHTSGIFSWHYLRSMCQCELCTNAPTTPAAGS